MSTPCYGRVACLAIATVLSVAAPQPSSALPYTYGTYNLTLSDAFGTGMYGSVTVADLDPLDGATSGTAKISVNVAPNYHIDAGAAHNILTFSLAGGSVDATSISNPNFSVAGPGSFTNSPFGNFTSAIQSPCNGGSAACQAMNGQSFSFNVLNFAGLNAATGQFNSLDVIFAADILHDGVTGAVGATFASPPNPGGEPVPLPGAIVLMGTILAGAGGVAAWRRRKRLA